MSSACYVRGSRRHRATVEVHRGALAGDVAILADQQHLTVNQVAQTFAVYPSLSGSITEAARRLVAHDDLE